MSNPILHYSTPPVRPIDWRRLLGWSSVIFALCWLLGALIGLAFFSAMSSARWQILWLVLSTTALYLSTRALRGTVSRRTLRIAMTSLFFTQMLLFMTMVVTRSGVYSRIGAAPSVGVYWLPVVSRFGYTHWLIVLPLVWPESNDERSDARSIHRLSLSAAAIGCVLLSAWTARIVIRVMQADLMQYLASSLKSLDGVGDLIPPIAGATLIILGGLYARNAIRDARPVIVTSILLLAPAALHIATLAGTQPVDLEIAALMWASALRAIQSGMVAFVLAIALVARQRALRPI